MQLRPYQIAFVEAVEAGWKQFRKQLGVAPTSAGKTIVFSHLAKRRLDSTGQKTLIMAHRDELLDQSISKLHAATGIFADKEKAEFNARLSAPVVVASVQTMIRRLDKWPSDHFGMVIVDECFPAGTMIDGTPIESLQVGNSIDSFDHANKTIRKNRIISLMKRTTNTICKINLVDGRSIICTPDHPIWNGNNYIAASAFSCNNMVHEKIYNSENLLGLPNHLPTEILEFSDDSLLLERMQKVGSSGSFQEGPSHLPGVRCCFYHFWKKVISSFKWANLLLQSLFFLIQSKNKLENFGRNESQIRFCKDENKKSDVRSSGQRKNAPKINWPSIFASWRKWSLFTASNSFLQCLIENFQLRFCFGISNPHSWLWDKCSPKFIQSGHCASFIEVGRRDRWEKPFKTCNQIKRQQENFGIKPVRVDSVKIYERGNSIEFERLCPDGFVYNIEVERDNNYFANGFLVHNCHRMMADSYLTIANHFNGADWLGVTATKDRGDQKDLGKFFENVAYEISLLELIKDKFVSPIIIKSVPIKIDLSSVSSIAGDLDSGELGHVLEPYLEQIANEIKVHAGNRRTLCFLPLISTSKKFVEHCVAAGITARHVDGESPDRKEIAIAFERGDFQLCSNAMLWTEGFDSPPISCIVVLRPTRSRSLFVQMVGRGLRLCEGKQNLLLLDFLFQHEKHSLVRPASLIAASDEEAQSITELYETGGDGEEQDLLDLASEAASQREEALRKKLEALKNRKSKFISAEEFAISHHQLAIAEFEPTMRWHSDSVTPKQAKYIEQAGIDISSVRGKGHASILLDTIFKESGAQPASNGQRWVMRQAGWLSRDGKRNASQATRAEAREFFADRNKKKVESVQEEVPF